MEGERNYKREEEILSAIAQSITGNHSLTVVIGDDPALGYTDGKRIFVANDDVLDNFIKTKHDNFLMRLKLMVHETLHCVYTDFKYLKWLEEDVYEELKDNWDKFDENDSNLFPTIHNIFNMLEDILIESRVKNVFDGWLLEGFCYGSNIMKIDAPEVQADKPLTEWFNAFIQYRDGLNAENNKIKGVFNFDSAKEIFLTTVQELSLIISTNKKEKSYRNIVLNVLDGLYEKEEIEENIQNNLSSKSDIKSEPNAVGSFDNNTSRLPEPEMEESSNGTSNGDGSSKGEMADNKEESNKSSNEDNSSNKSVSSSSNKLKSGCTGGALSDEKLSSLKKKATEFSNSFSRPEDNIKSFESLRRDRFKEGEFKGVINKNLSIVKTLENVFRKELKRQKNEVLYSASGRYDPLKASTDGHRTINFFKSRKSEGEEKDAAIIVSLDESGSMDCDGRRDQAVELAACLIESLKTLKEAKVQFEGWMCDSDTPFTTLYKSFESKPDIGRTGVMRALERKDSNTPLGYGLEHALKAFKRRKEKNKVFIMITDGEPSCYTAPKYENKDFIKKEIREMKRQFIEPIILVVGGTEEFSYYHEMFGDSFIAVDNNSTGWIKKITPKLKKAAKAFN